MDFWRKQKELDCLLMKPNNSSERFCRMEQISKEFGQCCLCGLSCRKKTGELTGKKQMEVPSEPLAPISALLTLGLLLGVSPLGWDLKLPQSHLLQGYQ